MKADLIKHYFPVLSNRQQEQFKAMGEVYAGWNRRINIISRKDMLYFHERHVLHSLAIAKINPFKQGSTVLDVGTGGGFPGIPLAIIFPEVEFKLIDSVGKKIKVVQDVIQQLALDNVTAEQKRVESENGPFDYVTSRAVARLKPLYKWVNTKMTGRGCFLALKGGDLDDELEELGRSYTVYQLSDYFKEAFFTTKKLVRVD